MGNFSSGFSFLFSFLSIHYGYKFLFIRFYYISQREYKNTNVYIKEMKIKELERFSFMWTEWIAVCGIFKIIVNIFNDRFIVFLISIILGSFCSFEEVDFYTFLKCIKKMFLWPRHHLTCFLALKFSLKIFKWKKM